MNTSEKELEERRCDGKPEPPDLDRVFPVEGEPGRHSYGEVMEEAADLVKRYSGLERGFPDTDTGKLEDCVRTDGFLPEEGMEYGEVMGEVWSSVLSNSVNVYSQRSAAHLQCPPTVPALAAEVLISGTNQSMDSYDQAPAASVLEEGMVNVFADLFGYQDGSDGVFTGGGTESNLLGLLLARDRFCEKEFGRDVQSEGLPRESDTLRVLCSEAAHFTVEQSCHQLGLGENAVTAVETDGHGRLDIDVLKREIECLESRGLRPFAVVATAGTTDSGAIDAIPGIAGVAENRDIWLHVDAAYGGACVLSDELAYKLEGVDRADSIAVDLHKMFFQPISCGVFLLRDGADYRYVDRTSKYLNPESELGSGVPHLAGKSLSTSRRFDALKPYLSFRMLGSEWFAETVEYLCRLASWTADRFAEESEIEVLNEPELTSLLYRYRPEKDVEVDIETDVDGDIETDVDTGGETGGMDPGMDSEGEKLLEYVDEVNRGLRRELVDRGVLVGRTKVDGVTALKLTFLNPRIRPCDVEEILEEVRNIGRRFVDRKETDGGQEASRRREI
ncbi:MAG: aspartate aminotransferase family protein [Halobacteria archaeon]